MELEIYNVFVKAGVSAEDAKSAVESINKEIDKRYSLHTSQLAIKGDLADLRTVIRADLSDFKIEIIKWSIASTISAVALFAGLGKLIP